MRKHTSKFSFNAYLKVPLNKQGILRNERVGLKKRFELILNLITISLPSDLDPGSHGDREKFPHTFWPLRKGHIALPVLDYSFINISPKLFDKSANFIA